MREAHKFIGELTWISGRTRPDIAYAVSRISRYTTHSPEYACKSGEQVISYLLKTARMRIQYSPDYPWPQELVDELPRRRAPNVLEVFADASFGQGDAKSQTGTVIALGGQPLGWLSLPQPFVALSTAEAEIIACTESMVLAQALKPLVEEIVGMPVTWTLLNDNVACNSVLSYSAGGWRTRHLPHFRS